MSLGGDLVELFGGHYWFFTIGAGALGAAGIFGTFSNLRRARLLQDTPISRIRSASQGEAELQGRITIHDKPLTAPLTLQPCVWFRAAIHRRGERGSWKPIYEASSGAPFLMEDGTGQCWVNPVGSEVRAQHEDVWTGTKPWPDIPPSWKSALGEYRYTEARLEPGDPVCVLGEFRSVRADAEFDAHRRVLDLLTEWKHDKQSLLARFDANRDGEIDLNEWERVRAAAAASAAREERRLGVMPAVNWIARSPYSAAFLISSGSEAGVIHRFQWLTGLWMTAALVGLPLCLLLVFAGAP